MLSVLRFWPMTAYLKCLPLCMEPILLSFGKLGPSNTAAAATNWQRVWHWNKTGGQKKKEFVHFSLVESHKPRGTRARLVQYRLTEAKSQRLKAPCSTAARLRASACARQQANQDYLGVIRWMWKSSMFFFHLAVWNWAATLFEVSRKWTYEVVCLLLPLQLFSTATQPDGWNWTKCDFLHFCVEEN